MEKLSAELERHFYDEHHSGEVTIDEIMILAGERAFGFLFILLALPSALPVPAPFYASPFGVMLFLLAAQLIGGATHPWIPRWFAKHSLKLSQVQSMLSVGLPWLRRIEVLTRPRLSVVCNSRLGRLIIGVFVTFMALSMMLPIPLTNTVPAMGVFLIGFGLLDEDGVISVAGFLVCAMGAALTASILTLGYATVRGAVDLVKDAIF